MARLLTTLLFDLKVYGGHHVPTRGGVLIVSNHQGNLDPVLLGVHPGRPLSYFAKSKLFQVNPALTWLLRALGGVPVKLGAGDVGAVKETIKRLRQGHALNMYPEGNCTEDGRIGPRQKGVALVVRRARVPVVRAVIAGLSKRGRDTGRSSAHIPSAFDTGRRWTWRGCKRTKSSTSLTAPC